MSWLEGRCNTLMKIRVYSKQNEVAIICRVDVSGTERQSSQVPFNQYALPPLRLPHFEIRSVARGRLKRAGDTFCNSNVFFLSYLLSPWAINFMPFLSSLFFFAIKVVPLSPSPLTASYSNTPFTEKQNQNRR